MRTLRLSTAGTLILALLGGLGGAVMAHSSPGDVGDFPTGTFVAAEIGDLSVEFNEDGTCRWNSYIDRWTIHCRYGVNGDLYTEMTSEWHMRERVPVTFYWDYDAKTLTFELWGADPHAFRRWVYDHTFVHVPDPRVVIVATEEIPAGEEIVYLMGTERIVQADESNADAFTDIMEVRGSVAAVTIPEGQPITPDLLEPAE